MFYGLFLTFKLNSKKQVIFAGVMGISYAISDEIHQIFVAGRAGQVQDVVIDSIGVILGICILLLLAKIIKIKYIYFIFNIK